MPRALPLTFFNDLTESPSPKPWLIKGVLARDETSSWIAPPGKGKSSLVTDIAVHQGGGLDWRGFPGAWATSPGSARLGLRAEDRRDVAEEPVRSRPLAHRANRASGDPIKTVTIKKANDQPEGVLTTFKLEPFDFGPDEDGDTFRTFILSPEIFAAGERSVSRQKLSDRQVLALRALAEVALSQGRDPPAEYRLPPGIKVVDAEPWRQELLRCNALDRTASNPSARFRELRDGLAARSLIGAKDDLVWAIRDHSV